MMCRKWHGWREVEQGSTAGTVCAASGTRRERGGDTTEGEAAG